MKITVFNNNFMETNTYLIENENYAVVVDPCIDYKKLPNQIKSKLKAVFITHGHFDHFLSLDSYLNLNMNFYMSGKCLPKIKNSLKNCSNLCGMEISYDLSKENTILVKENDIITIGDFNFLVYEFSGHSDCSLGFLIEDNMFSGDFLFKGTIGRTDLVTGSSENMKKSLTKIKSFCGEYSIYPGHGDITTLQDEKEKNIYLR